MIKQESIDSISSTQNNLLIDLANLYNNIPLDSDEILKHINNINENNESLLGIQITVKKKYDKLMSRDKLRCISYPNFLAVDTPNKDGRYENIYTLGDGFKIYIPIDKSNIKNILQESIDFNVANKFSSQIKLRNFMSNDALTIRTPSLTEMNKILEHLCRNKKNQSQILNPFIPEVNGYNITIDGEISYNRVLSMLIENYLYDKKNDKKLDSVSSNDFALFISDILNKISSNWEYYSILYKLNNKRKYQDFVIVANIIRDNINNKVNLNDLEKYKKMKFIDPTDKFEYTPEETEEMKKNALMKIITDLKNQYYNEREDYIEYLHKIMKDYVNSDNIKAFTRKNKIRFLIEKYYSKEEFKNYILEIGYEYFLEMCCNTNKKYGNKQFKYALESFLSCGDMQYFTNDNNIKSILKYVIPNDWLYEAIKNKNIEEKVENNVIVERNRGR